MTNDPSSRGVNFMSKQIFSSLSLKNDNCNNNLRRMRLLLDTREPFVVFKSFIVISFSLLAFLQVSQFLGFWLRFGPYNLIIGNLDLNSNPESNQNLNRAYVPMKIRSNFEGSKVVLKLRFFMVLSVYMKDRLVFKN